MAAPAKKGRLSKAAAQRRHAIMRARERYGLELTNGEYGLLCASIQAGHGKFLGRQSLRLSVWQITIIRPGTLPVEMRDEVTCNVIYDTSRKTVVTFLPPGITDAKGVAL